MIRWLVPGWRRCWPSSRAAPWSAAFQASDDLAGRGRSVIAPTCCCGIWAGIPASALERLAEIVESTLPVAVLLPDESSGRRSLVSRCAGNSATRCRPGQSPRRSLPSTQGLAVVDARLRCRPELPAGPRDAQSPGLARKPHPLVEELTPRELAVLRLLAEGLPNKTIALRLGISEHTVKFHVNAILGKLGVACRTEAVVRATRLGLILL